MNSTLLPSRRPLLIGSGLLLAGVLASACSPAAGDRETVSLPALTFLSARAPAGMSDEARTEQLIARSIWAVAPALDAASSTPGEVSGSAVAVSGATLLAGCDVAGSGNPLMVVRRSTRRPVKAVARDETGALCELQPADVWLRTVPGYRPFHTIQIGEPLLAVVSRTSRSFDIVRGTVTGKGNVDDPFLETSVMLPAGTRSAALFDRAGNLMGFGSAGPVGDAVVVAVPIMPAAAPWLAQVRPRSIPAVTRGAAADQS
jgi:hypothetical protein